MLKKYFFKLLWEPNICLTFVFAFGKQRGNAVEKR